MESAEYQYDVGDMVRSLADEIAEKHVENAQLRAIIRKLTAGKQEGEASE